MSNEIICCNCFDSFEPTTEWQMDKKICQRCENSSEICPECGGKTFENCGVYICMDCGDATPSNCFKNVLFSYENTNKGVFLKHDCGQVAELKKVELENEKIILVFECSKCKKEYSVSTTIYNFK